MKGFIRLGTAAAKWATQHSGVRDQLRAAIVERKRGAAAQLIARGAMAALDHDRPSAAMHRAQLLRLQALGIEREHSAIVRMAFLVRQLARAKKKLDGED